MITGILGAWPEAPARSAFFLFGLGVLGVVGPLLLLAGFGLARTEADPRRSSPRSGRSRSSRWVRA